MPTTPIHTSRPRRYAAFRGCECTASHWLTHRSHARHCPRYVDPRVPAMVAELAALEASREALS